MQACSALFIMLMHWCMHLGLCCAQSFHNYTESTIIAAPVFTKHKLHIQSHCCLPKLARAQAAAPDPPPGTTRVTSAPAPAPAPAPLFCPSPTPRPDPGYQRSSSTLQRPRRGCKQRSLRLHSRVESAAVLYELINIASWPCRVH
jgi:hypothetical protein